MLRQIADVLLHLFGPGCAVEAEDVDREGLKNRHHRCNVGTNEHGARGFHGHGDHQWTTFSSLLEGFRHTLQRCLDLQHVLAGLDDEEINPSNQKTLRLFGVGLFQGVEIDVSQGGQLCGGPHRSRHEARLFARAVGVGDLPCQLRGAPIQFKGLIFKSVFSEHNARCSKRVGLDNVAAGIKEQAMHALHRIWPGNDEILVTAFQLFTAKILGG